MNKKELYDKILKLDGLTNEEKSELLGLLSKQKKYGLVWEDKPEAVEERLREDLPVLIEDSTKAIISEDDDAPNHILIEGDNLEALTALAYTHERKIDVIYIDPPYNTGNKDFVYNDHIVDREDSYRHSKWLSFMSKRLRIAKKLLSDKGVIFISIDDNEQAQLKLLCDDIFGEKNFVGEIVWFKKRKGSFLSNKLVSMTEYILPYWNGKEVQLFGGLPSNTESQPIIKRTNSVKVLSFAPNIIKTKLPDGIYPKGKYGAGTSASELLEDAIVKNGYFTTLVKIAAPFVWTQDFLDAEINNGTEILINTKNFQVRVIRRNNDSVKAMPSFIDGREFGATNEDAYELLKEIFHKENPFQYSKPQNLVAKIILSNSYFNKEITILDFFAGSGTTLHATMQLNAEDGGKRKCILVTNNENNICEEVTYERNKRVINGYTKPNGEYVEGLHDNNLRYYRTSFVGRNRSMKNMRQLMNLSTDMLCIKEDLYAEQPKFGEQRTYKNVFRYFDNGKKRMMIIYKEDAVQQLADLIRKTDYEGKMRLYVFSPSEDPWEGDFEEVQDKVELCALPQAIYNAYRRILPKKKDKLIVFDDTKTDTQENMQSGMLNFGKEEELQ